MQKDRTSALSYIFEVLNGYKIQIALMIFASIIWSTFTTVQSYILKNIVNVLEKYGLTESIFYKLSPYALIHMGLLMTVIIIFRFYDYFINIKMIPEIRKSITGKMFEYILGHSKRYYQDNFPGEIANKINDLSTSVPEVIKVSINNVFENFLSIFISLVFVFQVNILCFYIIFAWVVSILLISYYFANKISGLSNNWANYLSKNKGQIVDVLSNIMTIHLFSRKKYEISFLENELEVSKKAEMEVEWTYFFIWLYYSALIFIVQFLCLYILVTGYKNGVVTVGDFAFVWSINATLASILWKFVVDFSDFPKHLGKINEALKSMMIQKELKDIKNAISLKVETGEIVFKNVFYNHLENEYLFKNLSVTINSKEKVGLVGYSGGGKSTFVNLIMRLYDVDRGCIFIDGQNIMHVTQDSLHESIALIPQEPSLFHRSIMENIRYGKIDATDEEVIEAAKRSLVHDFIISLPEGYDTEVGDHGTKLSGGQRQRIAIARAYLKNAPILILDEATSHLDSITEGHIQESLNVLMDGKTVITIAHRLSTLNNMDRILTFDRGAIVQDGSHLQLIEKEGLYKKLWDTQICGWLKEDE